MEVIYPKACGVDVHKSFIVAVICNSTSVKPQYLRKRFSTFNNSLIEFRNWLLANDCQNVCMESTGKYYVPVYNALEGHISNVVVANPKWVRCIKAKAARIKRLFSPPDWARLSAKSSASCRKAGIELELSTSRRQVTGDPACRTVSRRPEAAKVWPPILTSATLPPRP